MTGTVASETDTSTDTSTTNAEATTKPTETVEFWRDKAREQEKRAKANADAATRLAELEEAQKTESQKLADRTADAERERDAARAESLRWRVAARHGISDEDADLFLNGTDEETLTKQAERLAARVSDHKKPNVVPREGTTTSKPAEDEVREFARNLFGRADE